MSKSRSKRSRPLAWLTPHLPKLLIALVAVAALGGGAYFATRQTPEDHLRKGLELHKAGDFKASAIELKNALQDMPNHAEARFALGQIHFAENNLQDADKEFTKARELGLNDLNLIALHARTLIALGEPQRLLDEIPVPEAGDDITQATVLAFHGRAQLMLKQPDAAAASLAQAEVLVPDLPDLLVTRALQALANNTPDVALPLIQQALANAPERGDFWLLRGDLQRQMQQNDGAMEAYSKAIQLDPNSAAPRLARAQMLLDKADLAKASADIQAALKIDPRNGLGRYFQAYVEFRHSRLPEANNILQDLLRGAPEFMPAHLLAGAINVALGNREAARFHLDKVLGVAPQHPLALKLKAATMADLGDLDSAKQLLANFGTESNDPLLNSLQGQIALRQGKYSEAARYLSQINDASIKDAKYFTDLAASLMGSGDRAGATQALAKAADLDTDSARPDIFLVMTHLQEKRYDLALQVVDKLDKQKPNEPLVYNLRASIYMSKGEPAKARTYLSKALELKPDYFPAAYNMALLDLQAKDTASARKRLQAVLKINPKESRAWFTLARLDQASGNEAGYVENLEKAKNAAEKLPQPHIALIQYWLGKKDPAKALVLARSALDATGRPEFNEFIGLAQAAQGDHVNALATLSKWAEAQPQSPRAHLRLGQEQAFAKNFAAALQSFDKAGTLQPNFVEASISKALLLGKINRAAEGVRIAREIQAKQPKSPIGHLTEAEILFEQKQYREAAPVFAKASALDKQPLTVIRAAQAYALGGQTETGQQLLSQWLATNPQDLAVRHAHALGLLQSKRLQEAASQYQLIIKAHPKDQTAYNNLAWLLGELRDKNAVPVAEQALKLNPNDPAVQDTLGWILVNAGQAARGIALLEKAHAKVPNATDIHWHLINALYQSGNRPKARQELEQLLERGQKFPQEAEARQLLERL